MIYKWKRFHFENVIEMKTFSFLKRFRFEKKIFFVSETFPVFFRKLFHFAKKMLIKTILKTNRIRISGRGPCVPPCAEGQCFHFRRLTLEILLCRCLPPAGSSRSHCKYVYTSRKSFVVDVSYPWGNVFEEFMT